MTYRVLYWLGLSMALGFRAAQALLTMAFSARKRAQYNQQAVTAATTMQSGAPVRTPSGIAAGRTELRPAKVEKLPAPGDVSDRIKTVDFYQGKLLLGVMWIYLYPRKQVARRVLKVLDPHLVRALGRDRYFLTDVPFNEQIGLDSIIHDFHKEVSKLLDRRVGKANRSRAMEPQMDRSAAAPADAVATVPASSQPARKEPEEKKPEPTVVDQAAAPGDIVGAAKSDSQRHVKGEAIEGTVTIARFTNKSSNDGSSYKTFCLTIHDGAREIPYFGAELQRHVSDLAIKPGDRIRVVYMGKQKVSQEGEPNRFKNLYQVTRLQA